MGAQGGRGAGQAHMTFILPLIQHLSILSSEFSECSVIFFM